MGTLSNKAKYKNVDLFMRTIFLFTVIKLFYRLAKERFIDKTFLKQAENAKSVRVIKGPKP